MATINIKIGTLSTKNGTLDTKIGTLDTKIGTLDTEIGTKYPRNCCKQTKMTQTTGKPNKISPHTQTNRVFEASNPLVIKQSVC